MHSVVSRVKPIVGGGRYSPERTFTVLKGGFRIGGVQTCLNHRPGISSGCKTVSDVIKIGRLAIGCMRVTRAVLRAVCVAVVDSDLKQADDDAHDDAPDDSSIGHGGKPSFDVWLLPYGLKPFGVGALCELAIGVCSEAFGEGLWRRMPL